MLSFLFREAITVLLNVSQQQLRLIVALQLLSAFVVLYAEKT